MKYWWGDVTFKMHEAKSWKMGNRQIVVQRKEKEWVVWNETTTEESFEPLTIENVTMKDCLSKSSAQRYLLENTSNKLTVIAKLADRSVIVRPSSKLNILPGEQIELFVSTPLWLSFCLQDEEIPFSDIPFWLPSDSWFGPSPMVGELCYSKYTDARVDLANIEKRSHRAITTICISNEHDELLTIERLNLPTPFLNLYVDEQAQFWTDKVCLIHHQDSHRPSFEIKSLLKHSPKRNFTLLSQAREIADEHTFMRSIKSLVA